ncbi:MAG: SigB/SigF/SigG family RNA polymerase sigma factor, partial [Acidimicrobiia bacterium]
MRQRSPEDRAALVEGYEGLARALAARFAKGRESPEDLQQAALLGLLHAIDRFDPDRGVEFSTFAWATITGELKRHLRDRSWQVRVPRRLQETYLRVAAAIDDLTVTLGRSPTVAEIADATDRTEEAVLDALSVRHAHMVASLDAPVDEEGRTRGDMLSSDGGLATVEQRQLLSPLVDRLAERERRILDLRFVHDLTQAEIATRLGLSQMHVSRLLNRTLHQLRLWAQDDAAATGG